MANKRSLRSNSFVEEPAESTASRAPTSSGAATTSASKLHAGNSPQIPFIFTTPSTSLFTSPTGIRIIRPNGKLPGLSTSELRLLRRKQARLTSTVTSTFQALPDSEGSLKAIASTLIFAQREAGTAICIDPGGWILTCAHCFGDDEAEYEADSKRKWLLYYTGLAVQVECRVWDTKRDLALLKIVTDKGREGEVPTFQHVSLSSKLPAAKTPIICIGQPGRDDLESSTARKTQYNLVEISEGTFRGMIRGADPQDNSEIGTLMHDAWTYWGHSGAPLLKEADGTLIGLHSSWDDQTAMRHGIPLVAMREFLSEHLANAKAEGCESVAAGQTALDVRLGGLRLATSDAPKQPSDRKEIILIDD